MGRDRAHLKAAEWAAGENGEVYHWGEDEKRGLAEFAGWGAGADAEFAVWGEVGWFLERWRGVGQWAESEGFDE